MAFCPHCGASAVAGALFCSNCGWTIPQGVVETPQPLHLVGAGSGPVSAAPPPEWIPPSMVGRAVHCPRCNTLISRLAVFCPVCLAPQAPSSAGDAQDAGPP